MKKTWKAGVSIALCSAMLLTSAGGMLPADLGSQIVYADEVGAGAAAGREITENILANFNTGFEGVNDAGDFWWWSDANWSQASIKRVAHPAEKPFEGSDDYYAEVKAAGDQDKATCKICHDSIVALLEQGATYEYSYYAKLAEGQSSGNVTFGITSIKSDWSEQNPVTIARDAEDTLSADQWTKVTGTFVMNDPLDQVMVSFTGSEGMTFYVDDLRVGLVENSGEQMGENIIQGGDFASEDAVGFWTAAVGNSTISVATSDTEIGDTGLNTYGVINRNPDTAATSDCFSQDITNAVEKGETYEFSFWAKLSDAYKDAPEEQRKVEFAPYYVVGDEATYLGSYSTGILSGDCSQVLEPGVWTKYTGTFVIPKTLDKVVIRIIEQGTNWGNGDCVKGAYCVAGVSMKKIIKEKPSIEQDIPDWKDSVSSVLGENAIAGGAIMLSEITDDTLMDLVEKHFNAVTFGNELKPDALFNYQLENSVQTKTIKFDGQDLEVPVVNEKGESLDFSSADKMAEKILEWNKAHPDKKIRIRGHVLVWHSQTQEWFFHENYDISKPYVDKETMNRRLEWYISSVFDHYFGKDANGKYDGLFYGWDVVNEAVVGNGYRTDKVSASEDLSEVRHGNNSSWWHVYESNEFIINAFKYANTYAPEDVELYYNDYDETNNIKCEGILKLINDVKAAEGTRLDAFGMQAHYSVDGFSAAQFKTVAEKYAKAAGKVQLTELDFKASSSFDGSAAARESEYTKMAYCHKQLFDAIKDLNKEETKVTGLTVWGVIEPNSWLHSQSNVGGGANGSKQCPLLFGGNYKAKPAYWAYVDATKLQPYIQKITVEEAKNGKIAGQSYRIEQDDTIAEIVPVWDKDGLTVQVNVTDATVDATDAVTVYVDAANSASEGITPQKATVNRSDAEKTETGYKATVKVPVTDLAVAKTVGMDVVVMNGEQKASFNDLTGAQETSSKYYAKATMKPCVEEVPFGTVTIDGEKDAAWDKAVSIPLTINLGSKVSANAKVLWDKKNLYVYAEVADSDLNKDNGNAWEQDSLEVFIDENNGKTASYDGDDKQYRINYDNEPSFAGTECKEENLKSSAKKTADGYVIEAAFKWTDLVPENGKEVGLEFQVNDADASGKRIGTLSWNDETGMGWSGSNVFGTVRLVGEEEKPETNPDSGSGSSSTGNTTTTKPQTKPETTVETNADGSTTETSKVTIAITGGKDVEASVAVSKDADGKVTDAKATVSATKGELSAEVVKQLKEAAGTASIAVTTEVKDTKGNVKYTVSADSKDLKAGATLKVVAIDKKTGAYELVNAKSYKVDKNGNITVSLPKGADYQLLSTKEADKVEKAIVKTIAVKKSTGTVKKGKTTKIQLSSKLNMDNVKKVTYLSSKKSVATVNKSGKITAKKKGTVTVKATVTLKNGKKKTVSMKVTVK